MSVAKVKGYVFVASSGRYYMEVGKGLSYDIAEARVFSYEEAVCYIGDEVSKYRGKWRVVYE